jgi:DNA polymerase-3 subunit beta
MKVSVLTDNLQRNLSFINHAISSRIQLPILSCFLLKASNGKLVITGTDLEIGIEISIPVTIEKEGTTAVPAKLFSEFINSLPQDTLHLEVKEKALYLKSTKAHAVFQTMSDEEFPALYEEKGEEIFQVKPSLLKKDFSLVAFAASTETTRPALSGILLEKKEEGFVFVATDGYRLSLKKSNENVILSRGEYKRQLLLPVRLVREVLSFQGDNSISFFILPKNNQVLFCQKDTTLIGRLIEAEFPHYQKIIPSDASTTILFDREELQKAVKTCAIFARDSANIIKLSFFKEKIIVSAKTPSLGENTVEIEATLHGEENEIAFNARYLLEVLGNITEDDMLFEMTGPLNPGVFKIQNNTSFLHLIMPIRVQS